MSIGDYPDSRLWRFLRVRKLAGSVVVSRITFGFFSALNSPPTLQEDIITYTGQERSFRLVTLASFNPGEPGDWTVQRDVRAMALAIRDLIHVRHTFSTCAHHNQTLTVRRQESDVLDWLKPLTTAILDEHAEESRITTARDALLAYHRLLDSQALSDSALRWRFRKRSERWFVRASKDGLQHCQNVITNLLHILACCISCSAGDNYKL